MLFYLLLSSSNFDHILPICHIYNYYWLFFNDLFWLFFSIFFRICGKNQVWQRFKLIFEIDIMINSSPIIFLFIISVLSNHQTSISHVGSTGSPNQQNSSILSDSLIKIVLILLTGLLLANSVLFYKMWWLEANIGN